MLENLNRNSEKSELVEIAKGSRPQFKDRYDAIEFYRQKLEKICLARGMSEKDLLLLAESQSMYEPDLMEAHTLASTIMSLKSIG